MAIPNRGGRGPCPLGKNAYADVLDLLWSYKMKYEVVKFKDQDTADWLAN